MIYAVTGHRPETLPPGCCQDALRLEIDRWIRDHPAEYITGGARGTDYWAGYAARFFRYAYRIYLPFPVPVFASRWDRTDRLRLEELIDGATKVTIALEEYHVRGYHLRDRAMIDDADEVLAVWDGREKGGTAATVQYARKVGKSVHVLDPREVSGIPGELGGVRGH